MAFFAINGGYFNALNYFEFINNPLSALNTRYSSESALTKTFNFTMNNSPLFGLGFLKIPDIFAGDSSYLNIFYRYGMIGIIVMFLWYLKYIVINIFRDKKNFLIPVVVAVLLVFIGLNWTFRFESIIVWLVLMPKLIFEEEKHERYKIV